MKKKKLTPKQEKFCIEYLKTGNKTEAYKLSYNCSRMKDETINKRASELSNNGYITGRLVELKKKLFEDMTSEEIDREIAEIKKGISLND